MNSLPFPRRQRSSEPKRRQPGTTAPPFLLYPRPRSTELCGSKLKRDAPIAPKKAPLRRLGLFLFYGRRLTAAWIHYSGNKQSDTKGFQRICHNPASRNTKTEPPQNARRQSVQMKERFQLHDRSHVVYELRGSGVDDHLRAPLCPLFTPGPATSRKRAHSQPIGAGGVRH